MGIHALGEMRIVVDGEDVASRVPAKAAALLVFLADAGGVASRSRLAGLLWSDQTEERARGNLRIALTRLRRELGEFVEADRRQVRLTGAVDFDVSAIVDEAPDAVLDLYRGHMMSSTSFADAPLFDEWLIGRREALRRQAGQVLVDAALQAEADQDWRGVERFASGAISIEPGDEAAHRSLIRSARHLRGKRAAIECFDACRALIGDEYGLEPEPATVELAREIESGPDLMGHRGPPVAPPAAQGTRDSRLLVPPTPFFGRENELAAIERLVDDGAPLISLVGPGGIGKTRLAERAAARLDHSFERVVAVELLGVVDAGRVLPLVAAACVSSTNTAGLLDELVADLDEQRTLMLVDNVDDVASAAGEVLSHLSTHCRNLTVIITSRVTLGVSVEHVIEVSGLDRGVSDSPARRLFVERARRHVAGFEPDEDVDAICEMLGGFPLAIELAARWVANGSARELADRLTSGVSSLVTDAIDVPERHRSMSHVLELTWVELADSEVRLLGALAVFRNGFDVAAAEEVAATTRGDLQSLADRSLLRRRAAGRFEMHELIRQHSASRAGVDSAMFHQRHAQWYLERLAAAGSALRGTSSSAVIEALTADFDNVVAAWNHAVGFGDHAALASASPALQVFALATGRELEISDLFDRAAETSDRLERATILANQLTMMWSRLSLDDAEELVERAHAAAPGDSRPEVLLRAELADGLAMIHAEIVGDVAASHELARGALLSIRDLGDHELVARLEMTTARAHELRGEFATAELLLASAADTFDELGDVRSSLECTGLQAAVHAERYQVWEAVVADRHALALASSLGDSSGMRIRHGNLGASYVLLGSWDEAEHHTSEAVRLSELHRDPEWLAYLQCQLGEIAVGRGEMETARRRFETGISELRSAEYSTGLRLKLPEWARLLVQMGRWFEASLVIDEAVEQWTTIGGGHFVLTLDAMRARVMAGACDPGADEYAHTVWDRIVERSGRELPYPIESMVDCVVSFDRLGDHESAAASRSMARARAREVAASIAEPALRRSFLDLADVRLVLGS